MRRGIQKLTAERERKEQSMSFLTILDSIFFKPLQLLFEVIYTLANRIIGNPGASIVVLSLLMNFLVLPLYKRADAMQEEEKAMERKLRDGVNHIKKTFKGDEKMMMLQTYYRQNHYKPTYVLRSAVSLLLEIPFFIAAYRFLSGLQLLQGASFGPISDLGKPDGLLTVAGITVNVLPVIMTAVNLVSCVIFTKGSPLKTKIQLYAMALFFLVFLYTSPAGLVFYWTLNNVFSLVKTIFYKLKHSRMILCIMASAAGLFVAGYGIYLMRETTVRTVILLVGCGVLLQLPLAWSLLKKRLPLKLSGEQGTGNQKLFFTGAALLAVLTGILIPSAVIASSPQEFVDLGLFRDPVWYIVSSFSLALGTFVVWAGVFYRLAKPQTRALFDRGIWVLCGIFTADYMFFGKNPGTLSQSLKFESALVYTTGQQLLNLAVLTAVAVTLIVTFRLLKKHATQVLAICLAALIGMSGYNMIKINGGIADLRNQAASGDSQPHFKLSRTGKNVIVLMLDRGMNEYVPYMFREKPELQEQFAGFTYYRDVLSFGAFTNFGTPALLGGYEYTPDEINRRDTESLVSKQNEALKVMPVLFSRNQFEVTVCDPVYANYTWIPDLSIYDDYPEINRYITKGKFTDVEYKRSLIQTNDRNFFLYGLMKAAPLCLRETIYDDGNYIQARNSAGVSRVQQTVRSRYASEGLSNTFMEPYNVLLNLSTMSEIVDSEINTFLLMTNDTTHEPMMLQEPDYTPQPFVDNREYEKAHGDRFTLNGRTLRMENEVQYIHYQSNMAAMLQLGKWFDWMRQNGVWDNTRIILVADHGRELRQLDDLILEDGTDIERYYPLLMVKDFGSNAEFTTSDEFMTNGDVPTLAMKDLIEDPVNPFTGNPINSDKKNGTLYVFGSDAWNTGSNNGNTFRPGRWYAVSGSMLDRKAWRRAGENSVLPGGETPTGTAESTPESTPGSTPESIPESTPERTPET